jgi:hypothetical protein
MSDGEHTCRIDAFLTEARAGLDRVAPDDLVAEMAATDLVGGYQAWREYRRSL